MEDRMTKMEELYSIQTHTIEEMSSEMYQQQQDIARLRLQIKKLEEKIEELSSPGEFGGHERPPHY